MFKFFEKYLGKKQPQRKPEPDAPPNEPEQIPQGYQDPAPVPLVEVIPRDNQQLIRGNQKRFSEHISYNLHLLGQRLPDDSLVCETFTAGTVSKTKITMVYLRHRANPGIVSDIKDKLKSIKAETILDSSYVERNLESSNISPFPQLETTQRPDVAESALTQGRIAVFVDGSPEVLLAPATFFDLMDTPDDAYQRWYVAANFFRLARYIMFIFAVALPAFYIALTSYNPELIPTRLLFIILATREGVPFPIYFEAFLMMGIAEAIRMMMIRVPSQYGAAIALFAGLALVGAGLAANIIGAPIVIRSICTKPIIAPIYLQ